MDPLTLGLGGLALGGQLYGSYQQAEAMKASAKAQERGQQRAIDEQRQAYADVAPNYDPYMQAGLTGLAGMGEDYSTQMGDFEYNEDVNSFLDPSMAFQQQQMQDAMEQSAVSRGGLQSGGFAKALQDRSAQVAQTDYGNAYNRMNQDKATSYQQFRDQFASRRANNQQRFSQLQGLNQMGFDANRGMSNARMQQAQGQAQGYNQLGQAQALADTGYSTAMNQGFQNATDPNRIAGIAGSVMKMGG